LILFLFEIRKIAIPKMHKNEKIENGKSASNESISRETATNIDLADVIRFFSIAVKTAAIKKVEISR
jgi:hypothetical protein